MPSSKPTLGVNDLQSQFPDIAAEAYGWDPEKVSAGTHQRKTWICQLGHTWEVSIKNRTSKGGTGCPICSGRNILKGFNDLQTKFPEVAAEAYGWEPATVVPGTHEKKDWICKDGHIFSSAVNSRTSNGTGYPVCSGRKVLAGFNDLQTKFPNVAAEAYGWDPTTVTAASGQKYSWKCDKGHIYSSMVNNRTGKGSGCPFCDNKQVLQGFNDLQTKFPDIAAEAYEWNPSTVVAGTVQKKDWICKDGHIYSSAVNSRTRNGTGCLVCSGKQVLAGFNDLKTKFPNVATEAYGWDPTKVMPGTHEKKDWRCNKGHIYSSIVKSRTIVGSGCPICSGRKVLKGFNDLQTKFPNVASEAYGWDPTTVTSGSEQKKDWKCNVVHIYSASVSERTRSDGGTGCPFCSGRKVLKGFNDLQTKFPNVAAEAFGWDPTTVTAASGQKYSWKCDKGHIYSSMVNNRTGKGSGCPICAENGFNSDKNAWFYLMERPGEQQLGITNDFITRIKAHESNGWSLIEHTTVPSQGQKVLDTENAFKKWLRIEIGLMEGTTENWSTTSMEVQSLAELKARSGIETDLF